MHLPPCVRPFVAGLSIAVLLPGQAPTLASSTPPPEARPLVHLKVAGPAHWRTLYTPTNLGSMLASETGAALRQRWLAPLEAMVQAATGLDDAAYGAARGRLLEYAGQLDIQVWMDADQELPVVRLSLSPDGSTDLQALGDDLARAARRLAGGDWEAIADGKGRLLALEGGICLAEPQLRGSLIAVLAERDRVAAALAAAMAASAATDQLGPLRPALHLRFDAEAAVEHFLADQSADAAAGWRAAGLASLRDFQLEVGTAGPHVRVDLVQQFTAGERGVFGVLFPSTQGVPGIAALHGDAPSSWKAGRCQLGDLARVIHAILAASDNEPEPVDSDAWLLDPEQSIFNHFTDEYVMYGDTGSDFDPDSPTATFCMAFRIRDTEAFRTKLDAARKVGGMTALGVEDLGSGWSVQRVGGFFFSSTILYGPDLVALAFGPRAADQIEALHRAAKGGEWHGELHLSEEWQRARRHAPPGLNGIAEGNVRLMVLPILTALSALADLADAMPDLDHVDREDLAEFDRMIAEHQLEIARSMTGYAKDRWCLRTIW